MASITKLTTKRRKLNEFERKMWLDKHQIKEESLTEELKYLLECKFDLPVWHSEKEILHWMKAEKDAGRININNLKSESKENINESVNNNSEVKEVIKKARTKLILKERLNDAKDRDYLLLTFKDIKKKLIVFPNSFPWRWDELKGGNNYSIVYSFKENTPEYHKLVTFKKLREVIKDESYLNDYDNNDLADIYH